MAFLLLKQTVHSQYRSFELDISEGDMTNITALLAGGYDVYKEGEMGGTDVVTPAKFRFVKLGVSRKLDNLSATVSLKHVNPAKHVTDIFAEKALFDADFVSTLTATGIRCISEGSK